MVVAQPGRDDPRERAIDRVVGTALGAAAAALFALLVESPWAIAAAATATLLAAIDALPRDYRRYAAFVTATVILVSGAGQGVAGLSACASFRPPRRRSLRSLSRWVLERWRPASRPRIPRSHSDERAPI